MHVYIYDTFVNQKRNDSVVAKVETRITDLGLNGKIVRLSLMNNIYNVVESEIKKGAKTIVAVGGDHILNQAVNAMARIGLANALSRGVPLGFIPIGKKNNTIAPFLGIRPEEAACNTLSARRVERLDLGLANGHYFLTELVIPTEETAVEIDRNYSIETEKPGYVYVVNLLTNCPMPKKTETKPNDGKMELFFAPKKEIKKESGALVKSVFSFRKLTIFNKKHPAVLDGVVEMKTPVEIETAEEKINFIVGKGREF